MPTSTRTRIPSHAAAAGTSGKRALLLPDLVQDTTNRRKQAEADTAAYLAAGGKQPGKVFTQDEQESEYIRELTSTTNYSTFMSI